MTGSRTNNGEYGNNFESDVSAKQGKSNDSVAAKKDTPAWASNIDGIGAGCGGRNPLGASTMCEYERACLVSQLRGGAAIARGFIAALGADGSAYASEMGSGDERGAYPSAEALYTELLGDGRAGAGGCEAGCSGGEGLCRSAARRPAAGAAATA